MRIHNIFKKHGTLNTAYRIGIDELKRVDVIRDLGVLFEERLCFKKQIDHVVSKSSMILGFIKRQSKEFQCPYVTKALYCSLVRSILEYSHVIWYPATLEDTKRLESVQKQFLLFALRNLGWSRDWNQFPSYHSRLKLIKMESLEFRRKIACCLFVYDVLQNKINVKALSDLIVIRESNINTRQNMKFKIQVPFASTNYQKNETIRRCCRLFNQVSDAYIESNGSRNVFRKKISEDNNYVSKLLALRL
jgi:hypothetical protein